MGKGGTPAQSEASAVMELAERFSFFSFCKEPQNFFVEEYRNVKGPVLPFESIALSVNDESEDLERSREIFERIPLQWTRGYNLTRNEEVLVPFNWFFMINEFNGPSAGNCVEEAVLQGICEIVERHVSSIVSRGRLQTPAVDLDSAADPLVREMIWKYRKAGIKLFANDFSLDTGIPSVGVMAYDPVTFPEKSEIVWTAGTTPDPQKALSRALTEVAQLAGDFNTSSNYVASGLPKFKDPVQAGFIMHPKSSVSIFDMPDLSSANIRVEVENCVKALSRMGMEVILVNVTHPKLQIPAFYTIIPGAHFRERAAGTSVGMFAAKMIAENSDSRGAVDRLQHMDKQLPGKYYIKFFLGIAHLNEQAPVKALKYFEEALELDPKTEDIPSIYSYMGVCLKESGQYKEALGVLEKAECYDKDRTDVYNLMGFCYFKLKEHAKAIECFRNVLRLNPSSAIDYANIASNYRDMGDREQAVRYYQLALELDPAIDWVRDNLRKLKQGESA
jgi:ribosomal protein S12 methylthiotransferase accessory factor